MKIIKKRIKIRIKKRHLCILINPYLSLLILILISTQGLALDSGSIEVKVTINKKPNVESLQPNDGYTISEGDTLEISVNATDPNNDVLQYQFYVNNGVKQPWSTEDSFSYTLTEDDIGLNKIKAEVKDGIETIQTQEVEIYVFRRALDLPTT